MIALERAADAELLAWPAHRSLVIVTLDSDFARLLATTGASKPSVIHIRLVSLNRTRAISLLETLLDRLDEQLKARCIASVSPTGVRIRGGFHCRFSPGMMRRIAAATAP